MAEIVKKTVARLGALGVLALVGALFADGNWLGGFTLLLFGIPFWALLSYFLLWPTRALAAVRRGHAQMDQAPQ